MASNIARPRTLRQAKAAYSTNPELAWWVFMRVSGLLLVFLVFGHLFFNNILVNAGEIDYNYIAERFGRPWVKIYDSFLLGFGLLHAANGMRYSIEDYIAKPGKRFWAKIILFTIVALLLIFGVMTLWAIEPEIIESAVEHGAGN